MWFKQFSDEVSDARRAGDIDTAYKLTAETLKLFENSAFGKCITNKEILFLQTYGNEDNISKKINSPHFNDLKLLYGKNMK